MKKCSKCGIEKELSDFSKGRNQCRDCKKELAKEYRKENPEYQKEYRKENIEKLKELAKEYKKENAEKRNDYVRSRKKTNVNFRIRCNLTTRIWKALKNGTKSASTIELLGCTVPFLKKYLSKLFTKGMTLENYGEWHVDHIIPCASFDLEIPEQQKICFNYRNLQPLWAKDNLNKGGKLPDDPQMPLPL